MGKIIAAVYFAYRLSLSVEAIHQEAFPCGVLLFLQQILQNYVHTS